MVSTIRTCYDAVVALALTAVLAIACGLVAAVIVGGRPPNLPVAAIAFLLTGAFLLFRHCNSRRSVLPPVDVGN